MPSLVRTCAFVCAAAFAVHAAHAQSAPPAAGVKLSGYIQARMVYQDEVGVTTSINRARLSAGGPIASDFAWRIQGEFRTGNVGTGKASVSLQDAFIRWQHHDLECRLGSSRPRSPVSSSLRSPIWRPQTALPWWILSPPSGISG